MSVSKSFFNIIHGTVKKNVHVRLFIVRHISCEKNTLDKYRFDMTEDKKNFRNYFPEIKAEVMKEFSDIVKDKIEITHFEKFLDYNFTSYPRSTALMMMQLYRILENVSGKIISLPNTDLYGIGWLLEMLIKPLILLDDMIDLSVLRRGSPCWYRLNNNNKKLPSDNGKLHLLVFRLLEQRYKDKPFYNNVAELFKKQLILGYVSMTINLENRILDGTVKLPGAFRDYAYYKGAYYVRIIMCTAIYLAGYENELEIEKLSGIISDMACFIQAVNDRDDTFGVEYDRGKRCPPSYDDLKFGCITWFLEEALLDGNVQQKEFIKKYYGHQDSDSIQKIINVYNELELMNKFDAYAEKIYIHLMNQAKDFPSYFATCVDEVYNIVARNPEGLGKVDARELLRYPED